MMKKLALLSFFTCFFSYDAISCISCNRAIQKGIYNSMFYPNLLIMLSAFIVLAIIIAVLFRLATKRYNNRMAADPGSKVPTSAPLTSAAMVLGIGIGGFIDGIVLHQILQFHEMLTNKLPADTLVNKSINMFWDGIFHLFTLITTIIGVYLLWRLLMKVNINRSGYLLTGGLLSGWGLFNLVEGIIDHQILKLHNVNEYAMNPELWNVGFLIFGVLLLLIGWMHIRKGERQWR
jgi:uncharacterized membrane protein